ncbi:hypothetical protein C8R45DRAFT_937485 [Mycena sanguinolenta]|nr:hypothetical protein C8R45DRAFT_937485 [Mycena sanguinolenta]
MLIPNRALITASWNPVAPATPKNRSCGIRRLFLILSVRRLCISRSGNPTIVADCEIVRDGRTVGYKIAGHDIEGDITVIVAETPTNEVAQDVRTLGRVHRSSKNTLRDTSAFSSSAYSLVLLRILLADLASSFLYPNILAHPSTSYHSPMIPFTPLQANSGLILFTMMSDSHQIRSQARDSLLRVFLLLFVHQGNPLVRITTIFASNLVNCSALRTRLTRRGRGVRFEPKILKCMYSFLRAGDCGLRLDALILDSRETLASWDSVPIR